MCISMYDNLACGFTQHLVASVYCWESMFSGELIASTLGRFPAHWISVAQNLRSAWLMTSPH